MVGIIRNGNAINGITVRVLKAAMTNNLYRNAMGVGNLSGMRALGDVIPRRDCTYFQASTRFNTLFLHKMKKNPGLGFSQGSSSVIRDSLAGVTTITPSWWNLSRGTRCKDGV